MLAGTLQSPNRINPVTNIVKAKQRQKLRAGADGAARLRAQGGGGEGAGEAHRPRARGRRPRWAPTTPRRSAARSWPATARRPCSPAACAWTSPWTPSSRPSPTRRCARAWRPWIGARATAARWARWSPRASSSSSPSSPSRSKRRAGARRRAPTWPTSPRSPSRPDRRPPPAEQTRRGGAPRPSEEEEARLSADEMLARAVPLQPLKEGLRLAGYRHRRWTTRPRRPAWTWWAAPRSSPSPPSPGRASKGKGAPAKMSDVMKPGDIVRVRVTRVTPAPAPLEATLDQVPLVQGGLVVINPSNRHVVALVGGYDFAPRPSTAPPRPSASPARPSSPSSTAPRSAAGASPPSAR